MYKMGDLQLLEGDKIKFKYYVGLYQKYKKQLFTIKTSKLGEKRIIK